MKACYLTVLLVVLVLCIPATCNAAIVQQLVNFPGDVLNGS